MRRWVLVIACCLAVFAGVVLARSLSLDDFRWLWLLVSFAAFSLRKHNVLTLFFLILLFFGVGWWRGSAYMDKLAVHQSLHYQSVVLVGRATDEAVYGKRYQLEFSMSNVRVVSPEPTPLVGNVTVRGFGEPAVYRGDIVQVRGKLFPTRGNNLASVGFAELQVLQRDSSWINELRREFAAGMQSALPEPVASFGLGLLIGQRSTLPEETSEQLRHVGLTHIIAVSGYNLTIIVLACRRLLAKRSKFQATAACLALIGVFLLITGSSPPIVRAAIISLLAIGAWYYGRTIKPLVLLLLAAAITVLANPIYLWGNVSWYLSFLAFFGVLVLAPLVTKRLLGDKEPKVLTGILIESACASVLVLPYILYIFGEMSLVSLPANLLVIPFIPFAMLLGLIAGLGGMFIPALAGWLAWPAKYLLTYMLDIANLLSRIPHAFVQNVGFSLTYMIISYGAIAFVCFTLWHKTRQNGTITEKIQEQKQHVRSLKMVNN
jgi:competence protein ComEC